MKSKGENKMSYELQLLHKNELPGDIEIHTDPLSRTPSALSRKRAEKAGKEKQKPMKDTKGVNSCILCDLNLKPHGSSKPTFILDNHVAHFANDYPYLSGDQRVLFLWHPEIAVRKECLHRYRLKDFGRRELYWLVKGCIELGKDYQAPCKTLEFMRLIVGFNLGRLAGQSISHFHCQYGWEFVVERRSITELELELYFEELSRKDLVLYQDNRIMVIAPWTPLGQFALDVYFRDKCEVLEMDEEDLKVLAIIGHKVIHKYLNLGIQNVNIVFSNSPRARRTEPLIAHFVPRVNMPALYELLGRNVVDTSPEMIAAEFRRRDENGIMAVNWTRSIQEAKEYDPVDDFEYELKERLFEIPSEPIGTNKLVKQLQLPR
jgi:galactose-1-phosphate uridylyltransferase